MQVRDYGRRHRPVAGLQQPQQVVVVVVEEEAVINLLHIRMRDAIIVVTAHVGAHAITWDQ